MNQTKTNMSDPLSAGIEAGAGILSTLMTNMANKNQQKREMNFARESYATQRADTLADRTHEENFNSPAQQAQRLRNAGMNPMDYMADPVSSATGDSGSIAQPGAREMQNPLTGALDAMSTMFGMKMQNRQQKLAEAQLDEQRRINTANIEKMHADIDKQKADIYRDQQSTKRENEYLDMARAKFNDELRGLKLDNDTKKQAFDYNKEMLPLMVHAQQTSNEIADKTKNDVIALKHEEVKLTRAKVADLGQIYVTRGPSAFLAEAMTTFYGDNSDKVSEMIKNEVNCSADQAACAAINAAIEHERESSPIYRGADKGGAWIPDWFKHGPTDSTTGDCGNLLKLVLMFAPK